MQRYQLARYHVTDASDFYENNDRWEVAKDPEATGKLQPPYRLSVRTPSGVGGAGVLADLGLHAVPARQPGLVRGRRRRRVQRGLRDAAGAARCPATRRSRVRARSPTSSARTRRIQNELAKLTRNANVRVLNGNLLTLPVGVTDDTSDGGLLYVQPLYAVRSGTSTANYPVLQYVLVSLGQKSGIGENVATAVADVLGVENLPDTSDTTVGRTRRTATGQPEQRRPAGHRGRPAAPGRRRVQGGRPGARPTATSAKYADATAAGRAARPAGAGPGRGVRPDRQRTATDPRLSGTRFGASPRGR